MKLMDYGLKPVDFNGPAPRAGEAEASLSRRGFVMSSLASGFAVASEPVLAQAITTDRKGLVAGEVSIAVADGKIPAYRAMPAGPGTFPVMLVVQEIFGVHEHIKDMCRRYAKRGYYAIAPELFARQGDVSTMTDIPTILSQVVSKVPDAQVCADLDATLAFARASGRADAKRTGLVGYCWGGRTAWIYARHNPKLNAAVAYYGLLEGLKAPELRPQDPIDLAQEIKVPVLGLYSGIDAFVKQETIAKMRGLVNQGGSGSEIVVFPNVDHGFNADYRPSYDKAAATYAQKLANDWFKKHGV
ncbi:dienelactone hydrolase family protein [Aquariibacter albus]|uniref:Dienelactone hydrolase family protein n=1 Tax=Aquariibacter albus TaxID=2759899 RepID=A0A839HR05_9BURK|nr:dienelactone hydrolase family protein [Aquariibacter albus]MBB1161729.1 dienelactone hydrolase family protein [Aquariibacter albus]